MACRHDDGFDFSEDHALRSRVFAISSEQQSLLSRDNAWNLSPSNIPNIVLDHITTHLLRQRDVEAAANAIQQQPQEPPIPSPVQSSPRTRTPERFESQPPDSSDEFDHEDDHDTAAEVPISGWTSSPPHHMHPPGHIANPGQDAFLTQLPEDSPVQPTAFRSSKFSRQSFDFPPSSPGQQEEELDYGVPTGVEIPAIAAARVPVQVMATPPSAQIVPCSLEPVELRTREAARPKSRGGPKQTRYAPVAALYRPARPTAPPVKPTTEASKLSEDIEEPSQPNTFSSNTSSSIIPSTHQASSHELHSHPDSVEMRVEDPRKSPQPRTHTAEPGTAAMEGLVPKDISPQLVDQSMASPKIAQPEPRSEPGPVCKSASPPPRHDTREQRVPPYTHFCNTYKDYGGNLQSFTTACIYIQLQHKKIRSSLYDDFVRAWHQGYYAYVKACDSAVPRQTAMHAYAWYNEMDDDPLYNSRVITKQNLETILDNYPEEVKSARRSLGLTQDEKQDPTRRLDRPAVMKEPLEEAHKLASPPPKAKSLTIDAVMNEEIAEKTHLIDRRSPECIVLDEKPTAIHPVDFSKSMSELDMTRPQPAARSLARSYSEVAKHKRKASVDTVERQPKRPPVTTAHTLPKRLPQPPSPSQVSINPRQPRGSPAGSLASVNFQTPSSTDRRRRRFDDDPEMRKERFRQFLLKQKRSTANETIMSSAPTSAQRHS